jgi:hypothetical protein
VPPSAAALEVAAVIVDCAESQPVAHLYVAAASLRIRFGGSNVIFRKVDR